MISGMSVEKVAGVLLLHISPTQTVQQQGRHPALRSPVNYTGVISNQTQTRSNALSLAS